MHAQNFWKVNKSLRQKRCSMQYCVYPPEIIQSTSLGRLWKNHWNTVTAYMYRNKESENLQCTMSPDNVPSLRNYFQTNCQSVIPMLLKSIGTTLGQFVRASNKQFPQFAKLLSNKLPKCYSNAFKKHWNNTKAICQNIILRTWDMVLHTGLMKLHIFFVSKSTIFFSSTVVVISRLIIFVIRRQSSEGVP